MQEECHSDYMVNICPSDNQPTERETYGYGRVHHGPRTLLLDFSKFCVCGFFWNKHVDWDQCMYELELVGEVETIHTY